MSAMPLAHCPLWFENLIGKLEAPIRIQHRWFAAVEWLKMHSSASLGIHDIDLILECRKIWAEIPWDAKVPALGAAVHITTEDLARFLSDEWLNDDMINAGADYISRQLGRSSRSRIVNCLLSQSLQNMRALVQQYMPRKPTRLDKEISAGLVDILYLPLHVFGNHWTLLRVDLVEGTFIYHDSLRPLATPPQATIDLITWWLDSILPDSRRMTFRLAEDTFTIPSQGDDHSCGIVILSTLAWILLHYNHWSQETAAAERMEWFIRLSSTVRAHSHVSSIAVCSI